MNNFSISRIANGWMVQKIGNQESEDIFFVSDISEIPGCMKTLMIEKTEDKTKELLNTMGDALNLTIFINITGDFDKNSLETGEILLEGGEVFFNKSNE